MDSVMAVFWVALVVVLVFFILRESYSPHQLQQDIEQTRRRAAYTQMMIDQELGRTRGYIEIDDVPHTVTDREIHTMECDIGITICVPEVTGTTSLIEGQTMY